MRGQSLIAVALAAALATTAAFAGGEETMGRETTGRALLLAGEGAVAGAREPARVRVDLDLAARALSDIATLTLTPERVSRDEPFLVAVVAEDAEGGARELASVSFFPPPREGEARAFPVDLSTLPDSGETTLTVRLVPASDAALDETRVRVEGLHAGQ